MTRTELSAATERPVGEVDGFISLLQSTGLVDRTVSQGQQDVVRLIEPPPDKPGKPGGAPTPPLGGPTGLAPKTVLDVPPELLAPTPPPGVAPEAVLDMPPGVLAPAPRPKVPGLAPESMPEVPLEQVPEAPGAEPWVDHRVAPESMPEVPLDQVPEATGAEPSDDRVAPDMMPDVPPEQVPEPQPEAAPAAGPGIPEAIPGLVVGGAAMAPASGMPEVAADVPVEPAGPIARTAERRPVEAPDSDDQLVGEPASPARAVSLEERFTDPWTSAMRAPQ